MIERLELHNQIHILPGMVSFFLVNNKVTLTLPHGCGSNMGSMRHSVSPVLALSTISYVDSGGKNVSAAATVAVEQPPRHQYPRRVPTTPPMHPVLSCMSLYFKITPKPNGLRSVLRLYAPWQRKKEGAQEEEACQGTALIVSSSYTS